MKLPGGPFSAQKISGMADMGLGRHCGGMKFMVDSAPQMCYFISIIDMSRLDMLMVDILSKSYVRRDIVG